MKDQTTKENNNPKARKESKRKTSDGGVAEDNERLTIRKELQSFFRKYGGRLITVLFFVVLFVFGLFFLPNVNGNFDENAEQHILLANIKDYAEAFHVDEVADAIHNKGVLAISVNPNRDHGIAAYYLFAPMLILKDSHPHIVSVVWHFYTYCLAFIGVIFFYLLMQYLFKNKKLSVILTMLYYFTPRMFVDSLHNNKDIVFMALLVAMIYFGVRFIKEKEFTQVLDMCTGSGCIACMIAKLTDAQVIGADISTEALHVAFSNMEKFELFNRASFRKSDIYSKIRPEERFDMIVSNPPYIPPKFKETIQKASLESAIVFKESVICFH